jgi:hypothetical protein
MAEDTDTQEHRQADQSAFDLAALVASPHWEWAEGLPVVDIDGDRGTLVMIRDRAPRARVYYGVCGLGRDLLAWQSLSECRPDIEHTGSHGHMLGLVRKAWGPECELVVEVRADGSTRVDVWLDGCAQFEGASLGLALAAALLAAPPPADAREREAAKP